MAYPTNPIYKLVKDIDGNTNMVKKQTGNEMTIIPFDEANSDYQAYLEWAKTNTPEEAD